MSTRRQQPVITVVDARPMSETGFRQTPAAPTSGPPQTENSGDMNNGHVAGSSIKRTRSAPKRPPGRPLSVHQTTEQNGQDTHPDPLPEPLKMETDLAMPPRPTPSTRQPPEGAETTRTQLETKDLWAQHAQLFQNSVEMRRPPSGGVPPPLPKKSPSMGNLTLVGLTGTESTTASKRVPTPSPRLSIRATSINDLAAATGRGQDDLPARKPTIIRSGGKHKTGQDSKPNPGDPPEDKGGTDPSSTFGVKLRSPSERREFPQGKESNNNEALQALASESAHGWATGSEKKPPPIKPKPALLPKPALKPKPSTRPKSMFEPREKPNIGDAVQETSQDSAPAWMPKLKPTLLPKSTGSDAGPKEDHRSHGPVPMKATYRPTIIRASKSKASTTDDKLAEEAQEQTSTPPATAPKPQTKRKPTIIRPKTMPKPEADRKETAPEEKAFVPTSIRAAQSMPNIAKNEELKAAIPSGKVSPIHKSPSEEELENAANSHLEQKEVLHAVKHGEDDLDKPYPINYNTKPMATRVGPAKPPPPRPSSGPKKSDLGGLGRSASVKHGAPPRPATAVPHKIQRKRPGSMPAGSLPPGLPQRPGPGHPLYHYMAQRPHGIAVFDYTASQADELTVKTGDMVELLMRVDSEWIYGKKLNKEGLLPLTFLDIVQPLPPDAPTYKAGHPTSSTDATDAASNVSGPHCRARFDYDGGEPEDLTFVADDIIQLKERVGEQWLKGSLKGQTGMFPVEYVEILVDLPQVTQEVASTGDVLVTATYEFAGNPDELSFEIGDKIRVLGRVNQDWLFGECSGRQGQFPAGFVDSVPANLPSYKKEESQAPPTKATSLAQPASYCIAMYPYEGQQPGDLSFEKGDRIQVLREEGADWLHGVLAGKEGMFPRGFVEIIKQKERLSSDSSLSSTHSLTEPKLAETKQVAMAQAVFDFPGQEEGDLSFKAGDKIELLSSDNEWLRGRLQGKEGIFPANFVEILVPLS